MSTSLSMIHLRLQLPALNWHLDIKYNTNEGSGCLFWGLVKWVLYLTFSWYHPKLYFYYMVKGPLLLIDWFYVCLGLLSTFMDKVQLYCVYPGGFTVLIGESLLTISAGLYYMYALLELSTPTYSLIYISFSIPLYIDKPSSKDRQSFYKAMKEKDNGKETKNLFLLAKRYIDSVIETTVDILNEFLTPYKLSISQNLQDSLLSIEPIKSLYHPVTTLT